MLKLILTITFFVSSLVGGLYVVYPQYETYQQQMQENEGLKKQLDNVMVYIADLKVIKEKIGEREELFDKMKTAFPSDHDAPALFLYLKNRIEANNLKITENLGDFSVSPYKNKNSDHPRIKEMKFDIAVSGSYENMKNFLKETEQVIRLIRTDNLELSFDPFVTEKELYLRISAVAYSY
jgi:Tfp pilus assembly protein PilO